MERRSDIDGLRAIAVLSVVDFHLSRINVIPGGFLGVDIFFVISGYLISQQIFAQMAQGHFSISAFYIRRIRRIFPALYAVYLICTGFMIFTYFPQDVGDLKRSSISSMLFYYNYYSYNNYNYFTPQSVLDPIIHTWSLAVEEQFYFIFPIVIIFIKYFNINRLLVIVIALFIGFALSTWYNYVDRERAFYLLDGRAWEFLVGALLAALPLRLPDKRWIAEMAAVLGLGLIAASLWRMSKYDHFPVPAALGPCLGTALLIHAGSMRATLVSRLIAAPPLRYIGVISYSLYLWHWPIVVFFGPPHHRSSIVLDTALLVASLFAASLSWYFIERPFQSNTFQNNAFKYPKFKVFAITISAICAYAGLVLVSEPLDRLITHPSKHSEQLIGYIFERNFTIFRKEHCFWQRPGKRGHSLWRFDQKQCLNIVSDRPNYMVFGDSHAGHLWYGLQKTYPNINFLQATADCRPGSPLDANFLCVNFDEDIIKNFLPAHHLDGVILSARWRRENVQQAVNLAGRLAKYVDRVLLVGPIRQVDDDLPRILARANEEGRDLKAAVAEHTLSWPIETERAFIASALPDRVEYLSAYQAVTAPGCDPLTAEGAPVQADYGHLTRDGSRCVARQWRSILLPEASE